MKKYFITMILLMGLQSYKIGNVDDYELKVLDEILDDLIEKVGTAVAGSDYLYSQPPTLTPIFDSNDKVIGYDSVRYKKTIDEHEKRVKKLRDTIVVIAVYDSLFSCFDVKDMREITLTGQGYKEAQEAVSNPLITSRPLDLSKIKRRERFTLKHSSELLEGREEIIELWKRDNYDFYLSGLLAISRIYFDISCQFGLIYCSFGIGRLWGGGFIVCIHKINDKWTIEEFMGIWIS